VFCTLASSKLVDELDLHQRPLDGGERGEAPLDDPDSSLEVRRNQLARFLGEIKEYRRGFSDDEALIIDDRYQMEIADLAVGGTVEFAARVIKGMDAIGQPCFLERPLRPEVARLSRASWRATRSTSASSGGGSGWKRSLPSASLA